MILGSLALSSSLRRGPVKQLQQRGADAGGLQLLHEVKPLVALFQGGQGIRGPVQLAVDD